MLEEQRKKLKDKYSNQGDIVLYHLMEEADKLERESIGLDRVIADAKRRIAKNANRINSIYNHKIIYWDFVEMFMNGSPMATVTQSEAEGF